MFKKNHIHTLIRPKERKASIEKFYLFFSLFLWFCFPVFSQNIFLNESFEGCKLIKTDNDKKVYLSNEFVFANKGTPDFFNSNLKNTFVYKHKLMVGETKAYDGDWFVGAFVMAIRNNGLSYSEQIAIVLNRKLKAKTTYEISLYYKLSDFSNISIKNIGIHFSDSLLPSYNPDIFYGFTMHKNDTFISCYLEGSGDVLDSHNWTKLTGRYCAKGEEKYLRIATFDTLVEVWDIHPIKKGQYNKLHRREKVKDMCYMYFDKIRIDELGNEQNDSIGILETEKLDTVFRIASVFFDFDGYELKTEAFSELDKIVDWLLSKKNITIEIIGHTDDVGGEAYNYDLSEKRAVSVKKYLTKKGVSEKSVFVLGMGSANPIFDNSKDENREKNRRVEIKVKYLR